MKIICEHCEKEIIDKSFVGNEYGVYHEEDCFIEHCYMQYAREYTRKEYIAHAKMLEARYK